MLILSCFNGRCYCHFYFLPDVVAILNYLAAFFASVSCNYIIGWCYCHVADVITTEYCVIWKWWQMWFPCGRWTGHLLGLSCWCYCPVIDGMATVGWRLPWGSHVERDESLTTETKLVLILIVHVHTYHVML